MVLNVNVWMELMIMVFSYAQSVILPVQHAKITYNV